MWFGELLKSAHLGTHYHVIASQSADWCGNLQQSIWTMYWPINMVCSGFPMLIGTLQCLSAMQEIATSGHNKWPSSQ